MECPHFEASKKIFFKSISDIYGYNIVRLLKQWINFNKELIKTILRNKYLLKYKRSNVFPKHLNKFCPYKFTYYDDIIKQQSIIYSRFIMKMLNLEISDNFNKQRSLMYTQYNDDLI